MAIRKQPPQKAKRPRGKPPHVPTEKSRRNVQMMVGLGCKESYIAFTMRISGTTLEKYYAEDIKAGRQAANYKVAGNLFRIATGNSKSAAAAAMFWMKTRAGWKETAVQENVFVIDEDDPKNLLANILSKMNTD